MDSSGQTNPFQITEQDADVFRLRDEEQMRRKTRDRGLKIWQKGRSGPLDNRTPAAMVKEFVQKTVKEIDEEIKNAKKAKESCLDRLEQHSTSDCGEEKEPIAEFIAKKREMFLLQMSLDTKKEEIRKLEERGQLKEEALRRSERMLEEDAVRFDAFLKENDKKAQEATRSAEKETKKKTDKVQEIKKINQQIQIVQADIGKHAEALEDCLKYKTFLDQLTPPEWFEEQANIKRSRQEERRKRRICRRKNDWREEQERRLLEQKAREEAESQKKGARACRRRKGRMQENNASKSILPPEPDFEDEPLTSSDEEPPMYFKRPQQLLDIFAALEEDNLFLIQNMQEAEQSLEELEQRYCATQHRMEEKSHALEENSVDLRKRIDKEKARVQNLRERAERKSGGVQKSDAPLLSSLHTMVKDVYQRCGYSDAGSTPSTLFMLSEIEAGMEELLAKIEGLPADYVRKAEKVKEKKRRELKRAQQQAAQEKAQEERNRKAIERSLQPPKKRISRQVMFRSQPIRQKVREEKKEPTQEELDEMRHLS